MTRATARRRHPGASDDRAASRRARSALMNSSADVRGVRRRLSPSRQGYVVVLADALQDQERRRGVAAVGDEVRPSRRDRVRLTGAELHFLLGIAQEEPDAALEDIERVA